LASPAIQPLQTGLLRDVFRHSIGDYQRKTAQGWLRQKVALIVEKNPEWNDSLRIGTRLNGSSKRCHPEAIRQACLPQAGIAEGSQRKLM